MLHQSIGQILLYSVSSNLLWPSVFDSIQSITKNFKRFYHGKIFLYEQCHSDISILPFNPSYHLSHFLITVWQDLQLIPTALGNTYNCLLTGDSHHKSVKRASDLYVELWYSIRQTHILPYKHGLCMFIGQYMARLQIKPDLTFSDLYIIPYNWICQILLQVSLAFLEQCEQL